MIKRIKQIWKDYGFEIVLVLTLLLLLLIYLFGKRNGTWARYIIERKGKRGNPYETNSNERRSSIPKDSKGEIECRRVLEKIFNKPFSRIRPDFLRNPVTSTDGRDNNLELDCYNEELKLAVEINHLQHYKYVPYMHRNKEAFLNQRYRDEMKKFICKEKGITLIELNSYKIKPNETENYLRKELSKVGYSKYFVN